MKIQHQTKQHKMKSITLNENNTQITIDGKEYFLVPNDIDVFNFNIPKEPELKTFEDCWNKVKPGWWISQSSNKTEFASNMKNKSHSEQNAVHLPTEKTAKQIQAAIKLFVVKQALQGDWEPASGDDAEYVCLDNGFIILILTGKGGYNPYPFKSVELAQKAIDIAKDIWLDYFGIENK